MALPQDMQRDIDAIMSRVEPLTEGEIAQLKEIDALIKHDQKEEWQDLMTDMITQMMFVSGETGEPSIETTTIIEEIVREQVVEMVGPRFNLYFSIIFPRQVTSTISSLQKELN